MKEILTVASGKGGVGKSTLCVWLAQKLTKRGNKVLLVDFDIGLRCLDKLLGVDANVLYDWGDAVNGNCDFSDAMLEADGIFLLPAPRKCDGSFTPQTLRLLMEAVSREFDYIICDSSAGIGDNFTLACCASTCAIAVCVPDCVSIAAAAAAADALIENGVKEIRLIINKFSAKGIKNKTSLNIDDMIDACGIRLLGVVPFDEKISLLTLEKPTKKKNEALCAVERIAARIDGEEISLGKNLKKTS